MARKSISILIAVYNCADLTEKCLQSVVPTIEQCDEILVYNNGSTDRTGDLLKRYKKKPFFRLVNSDKNSGFVFANNELIAIAHKDNDILLLNNDTEIPEGQQEGWLNKLSERLYAYDDVGIMSCRQIDNRTGSLVGCGAETLPSLYGWNRGGGELYINQFPDEEEVEKTNFACVLIRRDALNSLESPFLDKDVFAYTEDDRMIIRLREKGWKTYYTPKVVIYHTPNSTSKSNKELDIKKIHAEAHKTFVEKYGHLYTNQDVSINLKSLLVRPPGYAMACKNLIRGLIGNNVDVNYDYLYGTPYMEQTLPYDMMVSQIQKFKPSYSDDKIEILFQMADMAQHLSSRVYRILYTMLEVEGLPDTWVTGCNRADEVWVPDSFNLRTFKNAGVTRPIKIMPLGIDKNYFHPNIEPIFLELKNEINFLVVGEWGQRKNIETTIECFKKAFPKDTPVTLWIKTHHNGALDKHPVAKIKEHLMAYQKLDGPPVLVTVSSHDDVVNKNQMKYVASYMMGSFYRAFDLLINLSSGEGSDMPSKEALACGVPVMRTAFSAKDFLIDEERGTPRPGVSLIDYNLVFPGYKTGCPYYSAKEEIRWAEPNVSDVIDKMRYAVEHIDSLKRGAIETSKVIRSQYDITNTAKRIKERLLEIEGSDLVKFRRKTIEEESTIFSETKGANDGSE